MDAKTILARLRAGAVLSEAEIAWIARGLGSGEVTDAQAGAFAMGACVHGLGTEGRVALTRAMRDSGTTLDWALDGPVLDKHSTGGIGDCVSLVLAPALAACGAYVPMISGRGLGHTGGTLDKLEAIPGYRAEIPAERLRAVTRSVGCAIVGAAADLAPADRRLYAVRDETGTVASRDLVTASILSKKLAAGLDGLVLDVKLGSGAFVTEPAEAEALAGALVGTAEGAGCRTAALVSDMNQPVVAAAGNALEVIEVMETLTGTGVSARLRDLSVALGGELLALGGLAAGPEDGAQRIAQAIEAGAAAERFAEMVAELGGPLDFAERWPDRLPSAPVVHEVPAGRAGYVRSVDGTALGRAVIALGGGRRRAGERINPSVGLSEIAAPGEAVPADLPLALIHAASRAEAEAIEGEVRAAFSVGAAPPERAPLIRGRVRA